MKNYLIRNDKNGLFGDMFDFLRPMVYEAKSSCMKTDIKETEKTYSLEIELPGYAKEDINLTLNDGYLTIGAKSTESEEAEDKKDGYIVRERTRSCSRSYYVGELEEEDVKAKYENGILTVVLPKEKEKKETVKRICIE